MSSLASLALALAALTDQTIDLDGNGHVDGCETQGAYAYWLAVQAGTWGPEADAAFENAMVECYEEDARARGDAEALASFVASLGSFGALPSLEAALVQADGCGTPVSYAMRVSREAGTWIAVCADEDGRVLSWRGAL